MGVLPRGLIRLHKTNVLVLLLLRVLQGLDGLAGNRSIASSQGASPRWSHWSAHCGSSTPAPVCGTGSNPLGRGLGTRLRSRPALTCRQDGPTVDPCPAPSMVAVGSGHTPFPLAARSCPAFVLVLGRLQHSRLPTCHDKNVKCCTSSCNCRRGCVQAVTAEQSPGGGGGGGVNGKVATRQEAALAI